MLQVQIANRQQDLPVARALWRRLLRSAAPPAWNKARISVAVAGEAEMVELNRRFTGRAGDTDVLAFELGEDDKGPGHPLLLVGEIVVCASRAQAQARARGIKCEDELALYVIHGFLHLLGYDDHSPEDRKRMYGAEERLLNAAGVPYVRHRPRKKRARDGRKGR